MSELPDLRDRLPDLVHGRGGWSESEQREVADSSDLQAEWAVVCAGAQLHANRVIDTQRIAHAVLEQLRQVPAEVPMSRRTPSRISWIGLAAAAAIVIAFALPHSRVTPLTIAESVVPAAPVAEVGALSDGELRTLLRTIDTVDAGVPSGSIPHLHDLTDAELEQLLQQQGVD